MILVFLAGSIFLLFAVAALGVDVAYAYLQKNRLQNAVDAAAIAGTTTIYRSEKFLISQFPSGTYPGNTYFPNTESRDWVYVARQRVKDALRLNDALQYLQSDNDIQVDWYKQINPTATYDAPAVRVNLTAPTPLFFARAVGFNQFTIKVRATSVAAFPKLVDSGLPLTVAYCAADKGWNFVNQEPKLLSGSPLKFQFGTTSPSVNACAGGGASGMWTDFTSNADAKNVGSFIPASPTDVVPSVPLITEPPKVIQVTTGVQAVNYMAIGTCSDPTGPFCRHSVMPVLESGATIGLSTTDTNKGKYPIRGFICVEISGYNLAGGAYISGQFSTGCRVPSSGAGGDAFYGVIASSTLVE